MARTPDIEPDRSTIPSPAPAGASLCRADEITEGRARGFKPSPDAPRHVIVVRREGRFHGWLDNCPHYTGGSPMAWRRDAYLDGSGEYLACHAHGALFEIETGECVSGPCLGQKLTGVPLKIDDDGSVLLAQSLSWTGLHI